MMKGARGVKVVVLMLVAYVGVVVAFESLLGYFQPSDGDSLIISTTAEGEVHDRVVSGLEVDGQLYVAANHWPRAWYRRALDDRAVNVTRGGVTTPHLAIPIAAGSAEHERVDAASRLGPVIRILTGFPPRRFLRLDPR